MSGTDFGLGHMESSGQWNMRSFKWAWPRTSFGSQAHNEKSTFRGLFYGASSRIKNMEPTRAYSEAQLTHAWAKYMLPAVSHWVLGGLSGNIIVKTANKIGALRKKLKVIHKLKVFKQPWKENNKARSSVVLCSSISELGGLGVRLTENKES